MQMYRIHPLAHSGNIMSLARSKHDAPANVFFSLIGNDVCSSEHDFDRMRKPADFAAYVTASLQYLDTVLPQVRVCFSLIRLLTYF
jgi:hypothetical protein